MRGEFEVWNGEKLLYKDHNMLCDGAGKTLADIMTVSPSLSGIEDHATSSILDASNYTIQAISFGTASDNFRNNAHAFGEDKFDSLSTAHNFYSTVGVIIRVIGFDNTEDLFASGVKLYAPFSTLSNPPNPSLNVLEENTSVSAALMDSEGVEYSISSVFPGNGQFTNFLPSAIASGLCEDTVFSASLSGYIVGSVMGAFCEGSSAPITESTTVQIGNTPFPVDKKNGYSIKNIHSYFNEVSSMDVSGFVNMVMSSVPNPGYDMSSPASGLTLSANSDFSSNGIVEYSVGVASGDVHSTTLYGGIYNLGLWTLDVQQALLNGNTPPFEFSVLNNPRKYRLFSRKDLSKHLGHLDPQPPPLNGTEAAYNHYKDLTIKWRLHFL